MKLICDVCHGHRCVSVPGTGFWFLRKKVVCSACKGTGVGKIAAPPPQIDFIKHEAGPSLPSFEELIEFGRTGNRIGRQCYLCAGHEEVL